MRLSYKCILFVNWNRETNWNSGNLTTTTFVGKTEGGKINVWNALWSKLSNPWYILKSYLSGFCYILKLKKRFGYTKQVRVTREVLVIHNTIACGIINIYSNLIVTCTFRAFKPQPHLHSSSSCLFRTAQTHHMFLQYNNCEGF